MLGASHLKLMAGGGVASPADPLDVTQYTEAELRAGVDAAEDWGTYVMVHAYTPRAIERALSVGVRSIEHGHLVDEATVALPIAEVIDIAQEKQRLQKEIAKAESEILKLQKKLANQQFLAKAPEAVVDEQRERLAEEESARAKLDAALKRLSAVA